MAAHFAARDAPAPRAQIAHQVARVLIRRINLNMHHRLEQRGLACFIASLNASEPAILNAISRGIHVVIFAVIQGRAEIDDRKSREVAARGGVANSSLDRGNPVPRNGAAENIVNKLDAFAAFGRLHLDAADAELAVAAGLFLVLAFGIGVAANGFAIGTFGGLSVRST